MSGGVRAGCAEVFGRPLPGDDMSRGGQGREGADHVLYVPVACKNEVRIIRATQAI